MKTHHTLLASLAVATALALPALAQDRLKPVAVARQAGVTLDGYLKLRDPSTGQWAPIRHSGPRLAVGDRVSVCALAQRDGYLSIWSRTLDGDRPIRVFPNDLTPEDQQVKGRRIARGVELCLGDDTEGFGFAVSPPLGQAEVYLHWSPDLAGQFDPDEIPVIPDPGSPGASRTANAPYSATTIVYTVTD